jgi:hypothetical protein
VLIRAAAMAAPRMWGTMRIKFSSTLFFLWSQFIGPFVLQIA